MTSLDSLEVFLLVALHGLLEFTGTRGAVLVDDRYVSFDGSQLAVDLRHLVTVFGQGAFRDQHKAGALFAGLGMSFVPPRQQPVASVRFPWACKILATDRTPAPQQQRIRRYLG